MPRSLSSKGEPTEATSAPLVLHFVCPGCRRNLKSPAALAGKKVKCPQCAQAVCVPAPAPTRKIPVPPAWLILSLVLLATLGLKFRNLDHTGLTRWDEVFHAVVARNVLKHPLKPTLIDAPYLPYDYKKWQDNHIWLHKPILPFWQIALSFALFGVDTFALRLPSALLSTGAAWLTYLIGKELLDRRAALLAATIQAVNPFLFTLIHGYLFADHIDVALLFWVEVGIFFLVRSLKTGCWRDVLLAGVAQGLAFLCKSYLAGIILGVALTAWLLPICRLGKREDCRIDAVRLLGLLAATLLTVIPWLLWCVACYPEEFFHEDGQIWKHLSSNIENWAAPWDRLLFDYLIAIHGVFYTPVLAALLVLAVIAVMQRHTGCLLLIAWGLGVVLPHLLATTKTPSATLLALPPFLLLLGWLVSESLRGKCGPLAALTAILAMCVIFPAVIKNPGYGYPSPRVFAAIMWRNFWVIDHIAVALAVAAVVASLDLAGIRLPAGVTFLHRWLRIAAQVFCLGVLIWLGIQTVSSAWAVTAGRQPDAGQPYRDVNDPDCVEVGQFAREQLPANAVLLCEESRPDERLTIMFYADRTCYGLGGMSLDAMAHRIHQAGGAPHVVSRRQLRFVPLFRSGTRGTRVYLWRPEQE